MFKKFFFTLLILSISHFTEAKDYGSYKTYPGTYNDFDSNPYTSEMQKKLLHPHLLPIDHPIKAALDTIFCKERALLSQKTLEKAGFTILRRQPRSFIVVARHKDLPGYLVKLYLDKEKRFKRNTPGWQWFLNRIRGSDKIRLCIAKNRLKYFSAPKKWIYPLPIHPSPPDTPEYLRKNEILIVEDMQLVPYSENLMAWKSVMSKQHLKELYSIYRVAGGSSPCYRPDNLSYTRDGKFAFIDTEYANLQASSDELLLHLSPKMARFWKKLIR